MIRILTILLLFSVNCFATTYYVSNSGSDANTGLSPAQSWRTIAKVNGFSFAANDEIRFEKDGVWNEPLIVPRNDLTFSWYGSGSSYPIISGEATLSTWVSTGTNKWRASVPWADSTLTMVTISGTPQAFARDSSGWRAYTAVSNTSVTYPHPGNYTGQTLVMKSSEWEVNRVVVTSDNGSLLTFRKWYDLVNGSAAPLGVTRNGYKFFRFNDTTFLDTQNEVVFYYPTRHVYIYSTTSPTNVKTTNIDTLIDINSRSNITIRGIRLRYGGLYGIDGSFTTNLTVDSCQIEYMGAQGIGAYRSINMTVQNCTIDQCLQTGIYAQNVTSPYINTQILNNTISNVGLLMGMGSFGQNPDYSAVGASSFTGLKCNGNYITNVGDAGIKFGGNIAQVAYNNVSYVTRVTADRSAIYNFIEIETVTDTSYRKTVHNNFCSHIDGNLDGTPQEGRANPEVRAIGVYLDGRNEGDTVRDNVIWSVAGGAMSFNIDSNVIAYGNLCVLDDSIPRYNNASGLRFQQLRGYTIKQFNYQNNIVYASRSTQKQIVYTVGQASPASIIGNYKAVGTINNNFYNQPTIANYLTIAGTPYGEGNYNHANYVTAFGHGVNDIALPNYPLAQCLFLKNWSPSNNTTALTTFVGKSYINAQGTIYRDSIRLQPNTAQLLFPTILTPIIITIDSNPVITLPVNSTTISGIATGGTITSYLWRKKTGGAATITSPSNRVTGITGLVAGTYTFTLVATNSLGQTDSSFATVTVNPAPPPANVPPVVTITPNTLQITLPTNTVTLNGSATDSDGTIVGYQWVLVSGTGGTITTPTNDTTTITGLTAGTYIYSLTATDDVGATGSATVQVQVNPQAVISSYPKLRIKL